MTNFSPLIPLQISTTDGAYRSIKNYKELAQQHVKMLLLTSPGEKIMDPEYGVGVKRFLFENDSQFAKDELSSIIYDKAKRYLPYIEIGEISYDFSDISSNIIRLKLFYTILPLGLETQQEISIFEQSI